MNPSIESFNAEKYRQLMDGLECSEILFSNAVGSLNEKRWDSEFFCKDFLSNEKRLSAKNVITFSKLCNSIKKGIFDLSPVFYKEAGVPLIRTSEIKNPLISWTTTVFLDYKTNNENASTILYPGDLVFTKIGAYIGDVAMLPNTYSEYNFSQNVAGASLHDKWLGAYLLSFFLSDTGRLQILRSSMLSGQGKLELNDIRNYKIPLMNEKFCRAIKACYNRIEEVINKATFLYEKAQSDFQKVINYNESTFSTYSIRKKSLSLGDSGRLDAEYYQSKYDTLFNLLSRHECKTLGGTNGLVTIEKSIEPGSEAYQDEGIPFVRISNLSKFGLSEPEISLPENIVSEPWKLYPQKDTILFSKDGSVGIAYKMEEDRKIITSGGILHLKVKDNSEVLPDYLTLVLNSPIVQLQAERDAGGSIIQHWKPSGIEQVIIPLLPMPKQQELSDMVQESFALRRKSKQLLDNAVKAVEMAIETDEETALAWLNAQN